MTNGEVELQRRYGFESKVILIGNIQSEGRKTRGYPEKPASQSNPRCEIERSHNAGYN